VAKQVVCLTHIWKGVLETNISLHIYDSRLAHGQRLGMQALAYEGKQDCRILQ
jgi:hypothetical protein